MKEVSNVKESIAAFWDWIVISHYKRLANFKHKADGLRYWVIKTGDGYWVVNKHNINEVNRQLPKAERMDFMKLLDKAVYKTK